MDALDDVFDTDVLVIGGGLAGLRAAIAAREAGARVAIAVKGKLGRSGSSAMTTAGYAAVLPGQVDDSAGRWAADTMRGGGDIGDPVLVDGLCGEAAGEVRRLEGWGGAFQRDGDGYTQSPSGDHSRARVLLTPNNIGTDLTLPLAAHAEAIGVVRYDFAMALELVVDDRGVIGAVLLDLRRNKLFAVATGATVLATGGAGRLFSVTSNPNDVTGDGFALAAAAGARLRDMEFIQFYPWRCVDPFDKARVSIQPSTFVHGARLYNARGERFMASFNPSGAEISTRDIGARGIYDQMRKGLGVGAGVRLDLSPLSPATFEQTNPKVAKYLRTLKLDYASYPFIVTPEAHFWMGGLAVDRDGAASLDRLFAAGEVAGGVHGANRLNSNALPETLVFGARAGGAAARAAVRRGKSPSAGLASAARDVSRRAPGTGVPADELARRLDELRRTMWACLGIIREAASMERGLSHVRGLREELDRRGAEEGGLRMWQELGFLCDTAELSLMSALCRQESRGAHFRDDYPLTDDARWQGSLFIERPGGTASPALSFSSRMRHAV